MQHQPEACALDLVTTSHVTCKLITVQLQKIQRKQNSYRICGVEHSSQKSILQFVVSSIAYSS